MAELTVVRFGLVLPKFGPVPTAAPQVSPPAAVVFCAAGFSRSQSTTKFLLLSVQPRFATLVTVRIAGRDVVSRVWKAHVGRVSVYLLDTNCPENAPADRDISYRLYGGDESTRSSEPASPHDEPRPPPVIALAHVPDDPGPESGPPPEEPAVDPGAVAPPDGWSRFRARFR